MNDIIGPANALNSVTTRPFDGRSFGAIDTWMKDCSSAAAQDGTQILAAMLNQFLAGDRSIARANGLKLDGITPVVTQDNGDDMLLRSILQLIQRGQPSAAIDTGSTDALVMAPSTTWVEYKTGARIWVTKNPGVGANTTTTPTLSVSGLPPVVMTRRDGTALAQGDLPQGVVFVAQYDGTHFRVTGLATSDVLALITSQTSINLTANTTFYVRSDGSDSNNGLTNTPGGAFQTLQGAYNAVIQRYRPIGITITFQLGIPGTYTGLTAYNAGITGNITVLGSKTAPASYIITPFLAGGTTYSNIISSIPTLNLVGVTLDASSIVTPNIVQMQRAATGGTTTADTVTYVYSGSNPNVSVISTDPGGTYQQAGPVTANLGTVGAVINNAGIYGGVSIGGGATFTINNATFTNFLSCNGGQASFQLTTFVGAGNIGTRYTVTGEGYFNPAAVALSNIPGNALGVVTPGGGYVPGDLGVPWTSYNPSVISTGGTLGAVSYIARYARLGKLVTLQVQITITSVGSATGGISFALPYAAMTNVAGGGVEIGNTNKALSIRPGTSPAVVVYFYDGTSPIATSNVLNLQITYEALN